MLMAGILSACAMPGQITPFEPVPAGKIPATLASLPEAQRIEFTMGDGTVLVGTYFAPTAGPAPTLLMLHRMGLDKDSWLPLIERLRVAGQPGYAIFAIDLPGHGESGGAWSERGTLDATTAAVEKLADLRGADPARVLIIGASIGADAAVDVCPQVHCLGAISLSPGGFLNIPYADGLTGMKNGGDQPVLCLAGESDMPSADACTAGEEVGLSDYTAKIYLDGAHGTEMLTAADLDPPAIDLIIEWLKQHLPPESS
jgi:predicted esterase